MGFIESGIRAEIDLGQCIRAYMQRDYKTARNNLRAVIRSIDQLLDDPRI